MTKSEIISKVKTLNLPKGKYIVFGSSPMAIAGIRPAQDIDLLVNAELFTKLKSAGWKIKNKGVDDNPLVRGDFEAHLHWNFSSYQPTLEQLLETAEIVNGIAFASIGEVKKWKSASGRPKDLVDIELIEKYLANN
jgi:hypothetical protein